MKKKFDFDYFQKSNNNTIFEFPINQKSLNYVDKWSKLEKNLQKNRLDNYFSNDNISTLNLGSLKSMEWDDDDIKNSSIQKNSININSDSTLNTKYRNQNHNKDLNLNMPNLEKLIHPIDDDFETFIQNKIEQLEILKSGNKILLENNNNLINIINDNKKNINNINYNKIFSYEKKDEKSIIKDKNEAIAKFNKNDITNNGEYEKVRTKSFLADYNNDNNIINTSILNTNKKYENSVGKRNKIRLNKLLNKIKNEKKETEIINKPNKFKLFDNSDEKSNLDKIQKRYYEQFKEEDKLKDNEYEKDYFSTILYELNQGK